MRPAAASVVAVLVTVTTAVAMVALTAVPASAATPGWIRLAHLSPDTPAVDIYRAPFRGGAAPVVLPNVRYGTVLR